MHSEATDKEVTGFTHHVLEISLQSQHRTLKAMCTPPHTSCHDINAHRVNHSHSLHALRQIHMTTDYLQLEEKQHKHFGCA